MSDTTVEGADGPTDQPDDGEQSFNLQVERSQRVKQRSEKSVAFVGWNADHIIELQRVLLFYGYNVFRCYPKYWPQAMSEQLVMLTGVTLKAMQDRQTANHVPGFQFMDNKDKLHRCLAAFAAQHPDSDFSFVPQGWDSSLGKEGLISRITEVKATIFPMIYKPALGCDGKGIQLFDSLAELTARMDDLDWEGGFVVQKYIKDPFLVKGHKFNLRVYVLCASISPLRLYVYNNGMTLFCSKPYDPADRSGMCGHLTNFSNINETFCNTVDLSDESLYVELLRCELDRLLTVLHDQYSVDVGAVVGRIHDAIIKTFLACMPRLLEEWETLNKNTKYFELFGFDFLLDTACKVYLMEVNACPGLTTFSPLERVVRQPLIHDLVNLIDPMRIREEIIRDRLKDKQTRIRCMKWLADCFFHDLHKSPTSETPGVNGQANASKEAAPTSVQDVGKPQQRPVTDPGDIDVFKDMSTPAMEREWRTILEQIPALMANVHSEDSRMLHEFVALEFEGQYRGAFSRIFPGFRTIQYFPIMPVRTALDTSLAVYCMAKEQYESASGRSQGLLQATRLRDSKPHMDLSDFNPRFMKVPLPREMTEPWVKIGEPAPYAQTALVVSRRQRKKR